MSKSSKIVDSGEKINQAKATAQEIFKTNDTVTIVKINGHEVRMSDYMLDPKKYNSMPFKGFTAEEVISECRKSLEDKNRLDVRPLHLENYKNH